jgi:hypothetical protein
MATDGKRVLLFGGKAILLDAPTGMASGEQMKGDTWAWNGSRWVQIQDIGPAPRWDHALAFDDVRHTWVLRRYLGTERPCCGEPRGQSLKPNRSAFPIVRCRLAPGVGARHH